MRAALALAVLLAAGAAIAGKNKKKSDAVLPGWYTGIEGYEQAEAAQRETGKPLLVYFHAPWCPYCRRVNSDVLTSAPVVAALADVLAVQINGDAGGKQRRLMADFGAEIYPSLFIRRTPQAKFEKLDAFDDGGEVRSPEDFVAALRGTVPR